jgi:hypothetical protein
MFPKKSEDNYSQNLHFFRKFGLKKYYFNKLIKESKTQNILIRSVMKSQIISC